MPLKRYQQPPRLTANWSEDRIGKQLPQSIPVLPRHKAVFDTRRRLNQHRSPRAR